MTTQLITSGIDQVVVEAISLWDWSIRFRSDNVGLHHQLYLNGRLADWTESSEQRDFFCASPPSSLSIRIAAVSAAHRTTDLSGLLPAEEILPAWIHRPQVVRRPSARAGAVLEILSDHTTGQVSDEPLASVEVWPVWVPRWAFGEDRFGRGGFGYDGSAAPGLGEGAFGAGMFGMDADLLDIEAELRESGTHRIVLRTRLPDGQVTDLDPVNVQAAALPAPPAGLTALSYDEQNQQLQLQIN